MNDRTPPDSHMRWVPFVGTMLTLAFGIWAGVVAWGVKTVISEVRDIHDESQVFHREFNQFVLQSEKRLVVIEEQQRNQDIQITQLEQQHDAWILEGSKPIRRPR